jgi:hypothetical protein
MLFNFLKRDTNVADARTSEVGAILAHREIMFDNIQSKKLLFGEYL